MNRLSSATIKVGVLRLPAPTVASNPVAMERWYYNLSPQDRGRYTIYINELYKRLPASMQRKIKARYEQLEASRIGMGWIAATINAAAHVTSAAVQVGGQIYQSREAADLQRELTGQSITGQLQTEAIRQAFAAEVAKAQTEAMQQASQAAGTAQVATAQQAAQAAVAKTQIVTGALKPIIIGTVAVGSLAAFILIKKKKR